MNTIWKNHYVVACFIGMLSIPTMLNAADFISLDEHEKKLVAKGEIIVRVKAMVSNLHS